MKKLRITLLFTFFCFFMTFGQNTLSGKVTDNQGEPLPFANIMVTHYFENGVKTPVKTQKGTTTDMEGKYVLTAIADGQFSIKVLYLGFEEKSFQIDFNGKVSELTMNVVLESESESLEEIVVTSQVKGQMRAINQQLNAVSIVNVVSADRIQQNPDANAAEAIGRLPGVSVTRSGGEANGVIIRGMPSQYNTVLLNGIEMPSNSGASRNAGIAGISQNTLQGIEVFKAITPDMEGNTVSGAMNMVMRKAPNGFHGNVWLQSGYNDQNADFGNYKFATNLSNRFFDNKLGMDLNISHERTNRSTQSMAASYGIETADTELELQPMYLYNVALQSIDRINKRTSGSFVMDYRFSPNSNIEFSNFFSSSPTNQTSISKSYGLKSQGVSYSLNQNDGGQSEMYMGSLKGNHVLGALQVDYNLAYSQSTGDQENRRFSVSNPFGYDSGSATRENMSLSLEDVIGLANDEETQENLREFGMGRPGARNTDDLSEKQYIANLNLKVPFKISDRLSGSLKFGGMYRQKTRKRDYNTYSYGGPPFHKLISGIQTTPDGIDWTIPWVNLNERNAVSMENMVGGRIDDFLGGKYNFGWYPDIGKMNQIFDWWLGAISHYQAQGREYISPEQPGWQSVFGQERMMGWIDPRPSVQNDNTIDENYYAGYLMTEFQIGNKITFIPGVRYENTNYDTKAWFVERRIDDALEIPGYEQEATRENEFLLPMVHLKYKAFDWLQIRGAYTKTIFRPNYNWIVPYEFVDNALRPFKYDAGVPDLKVEQWNNIDLMIAFHSQKLGLLSFNGFYKTVDDKIWRRTWTRITSDDPLDRFAPEHEVDVSSYYNNDYETIVRGFEVEWQTNFRHLPKPFSYFALTTNYSYINNETVYPDSRVELVEVGVSNRGRPIYEKQRSDSTFNGPMMNQPSHLANVSLGFSYGGLEIWGSYQYIGETNVSRAVQIERDRFKSAFSRYGIQGKYELPFKNLPGMDVIFNVANINNILEQEYLRGDSRPVSLQQYGWTSDLGIRYSF